MKIRSRSSFFSISDLIDSRDLKRLLTDDEYISRFFLHCTDIPGDHLKNTEEMIIRALKWRKEKEILGKYLSRYISTYIIRVITCFSHIFMRLVRMTLIGPIHTYYYVLLVRFFYQILKKESIKKIVLLNFSQISDQMTWKTV